MVNGTLVFHPDICWDKFRGKNPALWVAANRLCTMPELSLDFKINE